MEDELDIVWNGLNEVNRSLDNGTPPSIQMRCVWWFERVYCALQKPGGPRAEHVYRRLQTWLDKDLQARVVPKIAAAADSGNAEQIFTIVAKSFADFCTLLRFAEIMLYYIGEVLRNKAGYGTIQEVFFSAFDSSVSAKVRGNPNCVHLLLQHGADVRKCRAAEYAHPFARSGDKETLLALLDAGCGADNVDDQGMTPLMCAAKEGHAECVQLLLERGADACKSDRGGLTAVHYTAVRNDVEMLRVLLASAADTVTLDPLFHVNRFAFVSDTYYLCALACGCRAIEVASFSEVSPIICGYSLSYRL